MQQKTENSKRFKQRIVFETDWRRIQKETIRGAKCETEAGSDGKCCINELGA